MSTIVLLQNLPDYNLLESAFCHEFLVFSNYCVYKALSLEKLLSSKYETVLANIQRITSDLDRIFTVFPLPNHIEVLMQLLKLRENLLGLEETFLVSTGFTKLHQELDILDQRKKSLYDLIKNSKLDEFAKEVIHYELFAVATGFMILHSNKQEQEEKNNQELEPDSHINILKEKIKLLSTFTTSFEFPISYVRDSRVYDSNAAALQDLKEEHQTFEILQEYEIIQFVGTLKYKVALNSLDSVDIQSWLLNSLHLNLKTLTNDISSYLLKYKHVEDLRLDLMLGREHEELAYATLPQSLSSYPLQKLHLVLYDETQLSEEDITIVTELISKFSSLRELVIKIKFSFVDYGAIEKIQHTIEKLISMEEIALIFVCCPNINGKSLLGLVHTAVKLPKLRKLRIKIKACAGISFGDIDEIYKETGDYDPKIDLIIENKPLYIDY